MQGHAGVEHQSAAAVLVGGLPFLPVGAVASVLLATVLYFGVLLPMGAIPNEVIGAARRLGAVRGLS